MSLSHMTSNMLLLCLLLPAFPHLTSVCSSTSMCDCMVTFVSTSEPLPSNLNKALVPGTQQKVVTTTEYIQTCALTYILVTSKTVGKHHEIKHVIYSQTGRIQWQNIRESYLERLSGSQPITFPRKNHSILRRQKNLRNPGELYSRFPGLAAHLLSQHGCGGLKENGSY